MTKKRNEHVIGEKNTVVYVVVCHKQEELGYRFYSQGPRHQNCTVMKETPTLRGVTSPICWPRCIIVQRIVGSKNANARKSETHHQHNAYSEAFDRSIYL